MVNAVYFSKGLHCSKSKNPDDENDDNRGRRVGRIFKTLESICGHSMELSRICGLDV